MLGLGDVCFWCVFGMYIYELQLISSRFVRGTNSRSLQKTTQRHQGGEKKKNKKDEISYSHCIFHDINVCKEWIQFHDMPCVVRVTRWKSKVIWSVEILGRTFFDPNRTHTHVTLEPQNSHSLNTDVLWAGLSRLHSIPNLSVWAKMYSFDKGKREHSGRTGISNCWLVLH